MPSKLQNSLEDTRVNLINILRAAFMRPDPKGAKRHSSLHYHFILLGPMRVKAGHKMLMKLTPSVTFLPILMNLSKSQFLV